MKLFVSSSSSSSSVKMAATGGGGRWMASANSNLPSYPSTYFGNRDPKCTSSSLPLVAGKLVISHRKIVCFAVQESSASTVTTETKEKKEEESTAAKEEEVPAKPKTPAKAPTKPLPQLMEEDVIPPLKATLETQDDISELELSFGDNKLEGSFLKKGNPYSFWAFFPDGNITGPKGFSLSSYGSTVSSVEPFLVDEKKVTAKLLVFWVRKRLAAQGIIPVWTD